MPILAPQIQVTVLFVLSDGNSIILQSYVVLGVLFNTNCRRCNQFDTAEAPQSTTVHHQKTFGWQIRWNAFFGSRQWFWGDELIMIEFANWPSNWCFLPFPFRLLNRHAHQSSVSIHSMNTRRTMNNKSFNNVEVAKIP